MNTTPMNLPVATNKLVELLSEPLTVAMTGRCIEPVRVDLR